MRNVQNRLWTRVEAVRGRGDLAGRHHADRRQGETKVGEGEGEGGTVPWPRMDVSEVSSAPYWFMCARINNEFSGSIAAIIAVRYFALPDFNITYLCVYSINLS